MRPGTEFLLQGSGGSLFELSVDRSEIHFRCKGCGENPVLRWERELHYRGHLAEQRRLRERNQEEVRQKRIEALAKARKTRKRA